MKIEIGSRMVLLGAVAVLLASPCVGAWRDANRNGTMEPYEDPAQNVSVRVDDLISRMTPVEKVADLLVKKVRAFGHQCDFGILGAKWVPRVLAEYGYIDDAWQIFVQENGCGYMKWLQKGEDTLWESWHGKDSHNHIMYGDFSAWAFGCVGGIRLLGPGFSRIAQKPHLPAGVKDFVVRHETPRGTVVVALKREADGEVTVKTTIPAGILD